MPKPPLFTNKLWCLPRYPHELIVHYKWEERAQWLNARAVMSGTSSVHPGSAAAWANNACLTELSWACIPLVPGQHGHPVFKERGGRNKERRKRVRKEGRDEVKGRGGTLTRAYVGDLQSHLGRDVDPKGPAPANSVK